MHTALEQDSYPVANPEISSAVAHGVRAPLAALRASIETLLQGFEAGDPRLLAVQGVRDEVVRLGHEMQTILDYAFPLPLQPISCSLREIVRSALDGLCPERRAEVWIAIEDRRTRIDVDGPLLSRSIARLLSTAPGHVHASALLRARTDDAEAVFAVIFGQPDRGQPKKPDLRSGSATSALGLVLARRDVERMGGRFSLRRGEDECIVAEIRFSALGAERAAA